MRNCESAIYTNTYTYIFPSRQNYYAAIHPPPRSSKQSVGSVLIESGFKAQIVSQSVSPSVCSVGTSSSPPGDTTIFILTSLPRLPEGSTTVREFEDKKVINVRGVLCLEPIIKLLLEWLYVVCIILYLLGTGVEKECSEDNTADKK